MSALPLLTASRLKDARACQRLHHYRYNLGYRPAEDATTLRFGSLIHLGLEAWWNAVRDRRTGDARLQIALEALEGEADPFEKARAVAMLYGYEARWGELAEADAYEVAGVEASFETSLVNPETGRASMTWRLAGKVDVLVTERATGRRMVVEHKTTSENVAPGTDYWRRLKLDPQVSLYYAGAEALGFPVETCLYDVLSKPAHRPAAIPLIEDGAKVVLDATGARVRTKDGKRWRETADAAQGFVLQTRPETAEEYQARIMASIGEDPNGYFARGEVVRLEGEVAEALFDTWQIGRQLREAELAGRFPRNPHACLQYGRTCPFLGVCCGEASLDDPTLFKKLDTPHPELASQEAA